MKNNRQEFLKLMKITLEKKRKCTELQTQEPMRKTVPRYIVLTLFKYRGKRKTFLKLNKKHTNERFLIRAVVI